jgi:Flp pilus assembly protein TadG
MCRGGVDVVVSMIRFFGTRRDNGHGRRGAAMVEMAIVLPLLLLLLLGIIEWGWIFFKVSQVNQAARHGVRVAIRPSATEPNVRAAVKTIMNGAGFPDGKYNVKIYKLDYPVGSEVTVTVTVNYKDIMLIGFSPTPKTLHGAATMAKEGPA